MPTAHLPGAGGSSRSENEIAASFIQGATRGTGTQLTTGAPHRVPDQEDKQIPYDKIQHKYKHKHSGKNTQTHVSFRLWHFNDNTKHIRHTAYD